MRSHDTDGAGRVATVASMDTAERGLETILVLTGVTTLAEAEAFPYRASRVVKSIAELVEELDELEPRGADR